MTRMKMTSCRECTVPERAYMFSSYSFKTTRNDARVLEQWGVLPTRKQPRPADCADEEDRSSPPVGRSASLFQVGRGKPTRGDCSCHGVDARPEVLQLPIARSQIRTLTGAHRFGPRTHRGMECPISNVREICYTSSGINGLAEQCCRLLPIDSKLFGRSHQD
jgi:hypothetical protein